MQRGLGKNQIMVSSPSFCGFFNIDAFGRIELNPEDAESLTSNLTQILDLVDEMQQVNTDGVQPMAHPLDVKQRLRADAVTEENNREHFQQVAPSTEDGLYLVPKVIE